MDRKLPIHHRMFIRFHQIMCSHCSRFRRQLLLLREIGRSDIIIDMTKDLSAGLSQGARERIKASLKA